MRVGPSESAFICPTYAKTSLTRALFDNKDFDKVFTEAIPLKRWEHHGLSRASPPRFATGAE
jgi:hypothetical protein